jgi:hypothetical protein
VAHNEESPFLLTASLMGGRVPDWDKMNIAQVIPEEQKVTPVIFMIIHHGLCVFFKNTIFRRRIQKEIRIPYG